MKYLKLFEEYTNGFYYLSSDFNPNKKAISMRDETINYLSKLYDTSVDTAYIDDYNAIISPYSDEISNNIRYISILDQDLINVYEYEDEWFEVEHVPEHGQGLIYWCDQLDGIIKCINKIYNK